MELTTCIGREQELTSACEYLEHDEVRLLTLTGMGGVGKTRLALEVVHHVESLFKDGSACVFLESVREPGDLLPALCQQLAVHITEEQAYDEALWAVLREKHMLLLLDNFEQLIDASPFLNRLLLVCPSLKLLVTSRACLHIRGEQILPLLPLALPGEEEITPQQLSRVAAVRLFAQRIQTFQPDFTLQEANAQYVAAICRRLDGLPLALELAAARLRLFSPQELLQRLERSLPLLTNGAQDLPQRQRTLRTTLAWSYHLLKSEEQYLFRCLSVFPGGFTLEMVEHICGSDGAPVDELHALLAHSLLQRRDEEGESRLLMLETVREFASELLANDPTEHERVLHAHALCLLVLAERAEPELESVRREQWQRRLERERANLSSAWVWLMQRNEAELLFRLAGALRRFWLTSGTWRYEHEYQELQRMLQEKHDTPPLIRAKALLTVGVFAYYHHAYALSRAYWEESLVLWRKQGKCQGLVATLNQLGKLARLEGRRPEALKLLHESRTLAHSLADWQHYAEALLLLGNVYSSQFQQEEALLLAEESLALFRRIGDRHGCALALEMLAYIKEEQGDLERTQMLAEESLALFRSLGDSWASGNGVLDLARFALVRRDYALTYQHAEEGLSLARQTHNREGCAWALCLMGHARIYQGDITAGMALLHESLASYRELGNGKGVALVLLKLACLALERRDYVTAWNSAEESLEVFSARESRRTIPKSLEIMGLAALGQEDFYRAACLLAAATSALGHARLPAHEYVQNPYAQERAILQAKLGARAFQVAWQKGSAMTAQQVVATIAAGELLPKRVASAKVDGASPLTAREREILRHLSLGLTNPQIARQLTISPVTVNAHVRSIYNKLAVNSRSEATRYALEHHLL